MPPRESEAATERKLGSYRCDVIEATGVYVSTIYRESSAIEYASPYFETMAFWLPDRAPENGPVILWQSAGRFEREADRQHDLAVRWFSREGVRFL
ncbi:MAG TPA: hypothetical protein VMU39_01460 [Solirubrobacteraceae bacterium]|nr:hypothetical protein [Solirubrobacteraceae bacterium]